MAALASLLGMAAPWDRVNSPRYHRSAHAGLHHVRAAPSGSCGNIYIIATRESAALSIWKPLSSSVPYQLALGTACGATDIGTARDSNEDNFFIAAHPCLLVVADGMGGHEGGEIASADAIELLHQFLRDADLSAPATAPPPPDPHTHRDDATLRAIATLRDAIEYANACIHQANRARNHADGTGMGSPHPACRRCRSTSATAACIAAATAGWCSSRATRPGISRRWRPTRRRRSRHATCCCRRSAPAPSSRRTCRCSP